MKNLNPIKKLVENIVKVDKTLQIPSTITLQTLSTFVSQYEDRQDLLVHCRDTLALKTLVNDCNSLLLYISPQFTSIEEIVQAVMKDVMDNFSISSENFDTTLFQQTKKSIERKIYNNTRQFVEKTIKVLEMLGEVSSEDGKSYKKSS